MVLFRIFVLLLLLYIAIVFGGHSQPNPHHHTPTPRELLGHFTHLNWQIDGSISWPLKSAYTCKDLRELLRNKTLSVSSVPFGRGRHKVAFAGVWSGRRVVVKRPHLCREDVKLVEQYPVLEEGRAKWFPHPERRVLAHVFFAQMVDELVAIKAMHPTDVGSPKQVVAPYYAGCLGDRMRFEGVSQFVVQEGPLLGLGTIRVSNRTDHLKLPWSARLWLLGEWLRLAEQFSARRVIPCSLGFDQLGFSENLELRIVDVGHFMRLTPNETAYAAHACVSDEECDSRNPVDECMKHYVDNPDRRCVRGTCLGLDDRTVLAYMCFTAYTNYFDNFAASDPTTPASLQTSIDQLMHECQTPDRSKRPSPAAFLHRFEKLWRSLGAAAHLSKRRKVLRQKLSASIDAFIRNGERLCTEHYHCIEEFI